MPRLVQFNDVAKRHGRDARVALFWLRRGIPPRGAPGKAGLERWPSLRRSTPHGATGEGPLFPGGEGLAGLAKHGVVDPDPVGAQCPAQVRQLDQCLGGVLAEDHGI